jgi:catechol 2,3-dioxygenase
MMSANSRLPDTARIGQIRLAISDLEQSLNFYTRVLGLSVQAKSHDFAALTAHNASRVLIELQQLPGLQPLAKASRLGLYHFALLLPTRADLASFVEHLAAHKIRFGSSDHTVSEALYLTDPDGIHIEVYADRPRAQWAYSEGEIVLTSHELHFHDLLAVPHRIWSAAPANTTLGHLHFWVSDLKLAHQFYCEGVGFEVMHSSFDGVVFISAGGYHHHVGLNTWAKGARLTEATDPRLLSWELLLESEVQVHEVAERLRQAGFTEAVDPWQNKLLPAIRGENSRPGTC